MPKFELKFFAILIIQIILITSGSKAFHANEPDLFLLPDSISDVSEVKKVNLLNFDFNNPEHIDLLRLKTHENKKITAFVLAVLLGHFGVHRLYLGTTPIVPICYVLTLGGGFGILPAIDAVLILTTRDLKKFEKNTRFFMWVN